MPSPLRQSCSQPARIDRPDDLRQLLQTIPIADPTDLRVVLEVMGERGYSPEEKIRCLAGPWFAAAFALIVEQTGLGTGAFTTPEGRCNAPHFLRNLDWALSADRARRLYTGPGVPQAIHGLPITPASELRKLAGASFCVSHATPHQLHLAIDLLGPKSILLLDNGAYSAWKSRHAMGPDWRDRFHCWALPILVRVPQTVLVIPDVIEGSATENRTAVSEACCVVPHAVERAMPVWHYTEDLAQLRDLVEMGFTWIAWGACGPYRSVGSPCWRERTEAAFAMVEAVVAEGCTARPRIHMLRGLNELRRGEFPFTSADSCNVGRNFKERVAYFHESIEAFRARVETGRFPAPPGAVWPDRPEAPGLGPAPKSPPLQKSLFPVVS